MKKVYSLLVFLYSKFKSIELRNNIQNIKTSKNIFLFCTPTHSNLGDQAQQYCWIRLFKNWYPDYNIIRIPTLYRSFSTLRDVHKIMNPDDKIFIHSGYLLSDEHPELPFILDIVRAFYDKPIVILPQTVNLVDSWLRTIVVNTINNHPNLTLICRDEVSLSKAQNYFGNVKLKLMPDVVTSLIGDKNLNIPYHNRKGVLFCLRNDSEKYYSDVELSRLRKHFGKIYTSATDTTISVPIWKWEKHREKLIFKTLCYFSKFQLIITDRYHGTIFSQIVNTPVIVISSSDHKLSSGVKWFPKDLFGKNIYYANDLTEAYDIAKTILERNGQIFENVAWFKDNYYTKIIDK